VTVDADKAKRIYRDVIEGVKVEDSLVPYNAEALAMRKRMEEDEAKVPQGQVPIIPGEWPSIDPAVAARSKARIAAMKAGK
jgi:hypothetical protein